MLAGNSVINRFRHDPLPWALWNFVTRSWRKFVSFFLAPLFGAPGLYLGPGCNISGSRHIRFGRNFHVNGGLWMDAVTSYGEQRFQPCIEIGDNVSLSVGVHITAVERIVIGNGVLMGSHILIADHNHGIYSGNGQSSATESPAIRQLGGGGIVLVGNNVWIGDNAAVLGPAKIGDGAVVAANSLVRGDIPPRTIVGGIPARPLKYFDPSRGIWERV
jgi:lipopolysaccharide O-acetyltransferase